MPRRPLPDSREREEQRLARVISWLTVGALAVLGLVTLVLYLVA